MEHTKTSSVLAAALFVMLAFFAVSGSAMDVENAGALAPSPTMQSSGMALQVSGLLAAIASMVAFFV